ncbi:hypothetical protein WESB_1994 [Brachyspira pilosicoli WesB]|uniref:Endonuclease GajA/Old nuclease/RecF-like AAA domain-containing protein n=1 Tax=Brachyspira pilosicoli WesB TaxID=1161918 RepID=K0JKJ1_BRAPL|nr:AAA family ATPase [Brachyspira pilosicoli]PLV58209.1 hypothetical protein BPSP16_09260 [Brachyspira pilosicoli SP16]CCG57459.1 hypothetical protein WESB_1994 [Brachyspira pilosicoli WesB]
MLEVKKYPTLYVKNFAKIKEAEIELAPFTLFVGDNNSGKSYLASLVWYIRNIDLLYKFYKDKDYPIIESLNNISNKIINESTSSIKINNEIINDIIKTINNILKINKEKILDDIFNYSGLTVEEIAILEYEVYYDISIDFLINKKTDYNSNNVREIKYYLDFTFKINNYLEEYKDIEINTQSDLSLFLLKKLYPLIFNSKHQLFLPISRTGFLLLKDLIIQKSVSALLYNPYDLSINIDLTLPIKNFFDQLSNILKIYDIVDFNKQIENNIKSKNIIDIIEKNILEGSIYIEKKKSIPTSFQDKLETLFNIKKIFYKSNNLDNDLYMHVSSAVVTEITPLTLFLKYGLDYDNIIMEEPEISLHPELQQQLTRVFIKLVNSNTNVLITTHSDTIVQHINNMIKLNSNNEERKKYLMNKYGYDEDDLISEDKVRMYQFDIEEDRFTKVTKLKSSEYGFEVPTFNKILKKISDEIYDFQEEL